MATTIQVDVVSAHEKIFSGEAEFVALPGEQGELGILPGHIPFITRIRPGTVRIKINGQEEIIFVAGGILEVQPRVVTVLADTAIRGKDLDEAKAEQARKDAEQSLADRKANFNHAAVQAELAIASAQLAALKQFRSRK